MWVSGRQAMRILAPVVGGEAQAKAVLRSGLAGAGLETGHGLLYDDAQVRALAGRALADVSDLPDACRYGLYVARLARTTSVDVTEPWEALTDALGRVPPMPSLTGALLSVRVRIASRLPWVATLCGFVVVGGEITGFREIPGARSAFVLEPPGMWFSMLEGRRLPTTVGGRPWHLWTPPVATARAPPSARG